jgi:hypothetical protein
MSSERDVTRIVRSWMRDDEHESADRVLDAVLDELDTTPQRRATPWPAWRFAGMNTLLKFGIAAAAVAVAAIIGLNVFGGPAMGDPAPAPRPERPSPTATAEVRDLPATRTTLEGGRYRVENENWTAHPFSVEVPDGWSTENGFISNVQGSWDPGQVVFTSWVVDSVYADVCDWEGTLVEVETAEEIAEAAVQAGQEPPSPEPITVDGFAGWHVEISVRANFDAAACDQGQLRLWPDPGQSESGFLPIVPGQTVTVDIVDVEGDAVVLIRTVLPGVDVGNVVLLDEMFESVQIEE